MRLVGIGDLHLDASLKKDIPDLNDLVFGILHDILRFAVSKGCTAAIFYGDVTDKAGDHALSQPVLRGLLQVFTSYPDLQFIILRGNHEVVSDEDYSLLTLAHMCDLKLLSNVKVITEPTVLNKRSSAPINLLPWPHKETKAGHLNVLHVDASGAKTDSGRLVEVEGALDTKHLCVAGHLHTAQKVRNTHFSGNVYQKTFGESTEKYFHLIDWTGDVKTSKVRLQPIALPFELANVLLKSNEDYDAFKSNYDQSKRVYYKVYVDQRAVVLPDNPFKGMPNVIKHNHFTTEAELKAHLIEELTIETGSEQTAFDPMTVFQDWMLTKGVDDALQRRATKKLEQLLTSNNLTLNV